MLATANKSPAATQTKVGSYRWTICSLVFFATTINYLDRQVISLLKPTLEQQFSWTESDYSNIVVAFQFAYAIGMVSLGRVVDKLGTKIGYALTLIFWSIASILHAAATGTLSFMIYRAFLGVTEAGNFPAAVKTVAEWFPQRERAYATGIFNSGTNVGAIIAPIVVPWLAIQYSWQVAFIATGVIGFIWVLFWFLFYDSPSRHKKLSKEEYQYIHHDASDPVHSGEAGAVKTSWSQLLRYKQAWAFIAGKFFTDGIWWFILFWLPAFLQAQYGLEGMQVSLPIAVVYIMAGVASIAGGWLPMWFVKRGWNVVRARKISMLIYACLPLPVIFAQTAGTYNLWYAIIIIGIAASAHQAWSANLYTTVSDMFPKRVVATVIGIGGMVGSIGGMMVSKSAGLLFDHYKDLGHIQTGYAIMFLISGLAYLVAWLVMFKLLVPKMPKVVL